MPLLNFTTTSDNASEFLDDMLNRKSRILEGSSSSASSITIKVGDRSLFEPLISNYEKLPDHLKSCFDYCCMFRYSQEKGKLIRLLSAEGLIPEKPGEIMEDTVANTLGELVNLGMLQEVLDQSGYELKVSNLYRQLSIIRVQKQDFVAHAAGLRRSMIRVDNKGINPKMKSHPYCSLFVLTAKRWGSSSPDSTKGLSRASMETICGFQFEFLVVLEIDGVVSYLPNEVGDLVNLRYLGLINSELNELPKRLGDLQKLQTLDIRMSGDLQELPVEVLNIKLLRHLLMSRSVNDGEVRVPKGMERLANLYTLSGVYAGEGTASELGSLTQLRELGVKHVNDEHAPELLAAITKMKNLISLSLEAEDDFYEDERVSLFPEFGSFSPPPLLQELHLRGGLVEIPTWLASMPNLTTLSLSLSNLATESEISDLQFLPKLKHLTLWEAYKAKKIGKEFCQRGRFPELQSLIIDSSFLVEWTEIERGAFPKLRCLTLRCRDFRFLPEGLQHISTLEEIIFSPLHEDLAYRLRGEESYKIKNIMKLRASARVVTRLPHCSYVGSPQDVLARV